MGDPMAIGMANGGLAGVMSRSGRLDQAIELMEGTVRQLDSIGLGHYAIEHTNMLVSLYKKAGRSAEALTAMEHLKKLSDSLLSADKQKAVHELEAKYQFDRQEDEKKDLRQQVKMNRILIASVSVAALALLIFGIMLRQRNRFQQEMIRSYERSLVRYRQERDAVHNASAPSTWNIRDVADEDPATASDAAIDQGMDEQQVYEPTDEDRRAFDDLLKYFVDQKPYLNPRLKVDDVSDAMGIPDRKLSLLIRVFSGQPFNQFVNRYRIDEATRMMEDPETRDWKIDVIADKSGFSSRQQFRRVFEQVTGVNPGFYRDRTNG
jgi:AraC-like DNA-binding protein